MRGPTLILMGLLSVAAVGSGAPAERVLSAEQRVRRALPDRDGAIWVLFSRSSTIHKYSRQGHILRGFDTSSLEEVLLSPGERKTLHDIALDSDGRLLALLGVSHRPTKRFASFILRFADLERQPEVISLENGVAGYKLGVDASGNFVILGLKSTDLVKTELQHISGRYPVVHRYTAGGGYAGSFLPMDIDAASEDSLTRELASPLHHPGNFAVEENGDVWVLWMEFPDEGPPLRASFRRVSTGLTHGARACLCLRLRHSMDSSSPGSFPMDRCLTSLSNGRDGGPPAWKRCSRTRAAPFLRKGTTGAGWSA